MPGTLFVVATPIGNLEDVSMRALRTLREVDVIAAEDTRRTSKLLAHYEIQKPLVSLHEHNETREAGRLVSKLESGLNIALVSDAGTPAIADPGYHFVAQAREAGIPVVPIPGANAAVAALSAAGLPADSFLFLGFPPSGGLARERWFERVAAEPGTVVFYESPHRIRRTMDELSEYLVGRSILFGRELTKVNEELVVWDKLVDIREQGEFVIAVGPELSQPERECDSSEVALFVGQITEKVGLSETQAIALASTHFSVAGPKAAKLLKKGRILLKRAKDNQEQ
ncbi:MAG TPA: 16S rRNA (cytidine(1402)-2'-O)-methyltransferase [Vicinamibacterales bacterium]|nr:16S rRNA (cytidine(1402)-2'-O)-methyltransferase [Vicinamibacterales bacterium]